MSGLLAALLVLGSSRVRRLPVTGPLLALLTGALLGPSALGVLVVPPDLRDPLLLEASRLLLALSLIGVALRFPLRAVRPLLRPVVLLVAVVMPLTAAVTGLLGVALLGLPVGLAVLLGACLSPTDPVLASDVVSGGPAEHDLPEPTRVVLSEESGANDGLALPLVLVALAPVLGEPVGRAALTSLYQVVVGVAVGAAVGALAGRALRSAEARDDLEAAPELALTLVMAVLVLGAARLLETDGVLAVFVAGLAYNGVVGDRQRERQDTLDEAANRYAVVPFFLVLGAVLPFAGWGRLGWGGLAFAVGVLVLRRPPVVLALTRLLGLRLRDAALLGWFGPIGVSAVFYLVLSADEGATDPVLFAAGTLAVATSTLVHGVTAGPGRLLYRRAAADRPS